MTEQYQVTIALEKVGEPKASFEEAYRLLYHELKKYIKENGGIAEIALFEGTWIEKSVDQRVEGVFLFADARDYAYELGLMEDGKIVD